MSAIHIKDGVNTILTISTSCSQGKYCLRKNNQNENIKIQDINGVKEYLRLEFATCGFRDVSPTLGGCMSIRADYDVVIKWTGFR